MEFKEYFNQLSHQVTFPYGVHDEEKDSAEVDQDETITGYIEDEDEVSNCEETS